MSQIILISGPSWSNLAQGIQYKDISLVSEHKLGNIHSYNGKGRMEERKNLRCNTRNINIMFYLWVWQSLGKIECSGNQAFLHITCGSVHSFNCSWGQLAMCIGSLKCSFIETIQFLGMCPKETFIYKDSSLNKIIITACNKSGRITKHLIIIEELMYSPFRDESIFITFMFLL